MTCFFKDCHYFGKQNACRVAALFIAGVFLVAVSFIIVWDLHLERRYQEPFDLTISSIDYHLNLQTFDLQNHVVRGNLELRFRPSPSDPPEPGKPKNVNFRFGPLVYLDGVQDFSMWILYGFTFLERKVSALAQTNQFAEDEPPPIQFDLQALGEARYYPFDKYLIVGAVKCLIEDDPKDASKTLKAERLEDITVTQHIPGFLIRQAYHEELKGLLPWWAAIGSATARREALLENWNKGGNFLLVLYRPLFLRFMAIFLGITASLSILYVIFRTSPKKMAPNLIGYLIALWAVREILSHGVQVFPTLVDYSILLLYSSLVLGVVARWIWSKGGSGPS
jgi:hypothetical protein